MKCLYFKNLFEKQRGRDRRAHILHLLADYSNTNHSWSWPGQLGPQILIFPWRWQEAKQQSQHMPPPIDAVARGWGRHSPDQTHPWCWAQVTFHCSHTQIPHATFQKQPWFPIQRTKLLFSPL